MSERVVIVGAGIGGLAAAIDLVAAGVDVTVLERGNDVGGKMREVSVATRRLDAGPSVVTMREVFDDLFASAGSALDAHLRLTPLRTLARHAWKDGSRLDLHSETAATTEAIAAFAGAREARGYERFAADTKRCYEMLLSPYLLAPRPTAVGLTRALAAQRLSNLWTLQPFTSLWNVLRRYFRDPRLLQLFGRYATYCGSSPMLAPATLRVIAHVEREGVWQCEGGMHRIAESLRALAQGLGARFRFYAHVTEVLTRGGAVSGARLRDGEVIAARAVVLNADPGALGQGLFGAAARRALPTADVAHRSLSAFTWNRVARVDGFPLTHHNVFFSDDYPAEFDDLFRRRQVPEEPTVYVCAQDRGGDGTDGSEAMRGSAERLFCLINAPADGDRRERDLAAAARHEERTLKLLRGCGLTLDRDAGPPVVTTPGDFEQLFPATGGALYGQVSHGWKASFRRPASRTAIPGLYLAGGATHPGPGIPMAALSGRQAAKSVIQDLARRPTSIAQSPPTAMPGGISTR